MVRASPKCPPVTNINYLNLSGPDRSPARLRKTFIGPPPCCFRYISYSTFAVNVICDTDSYGSPSHISKRVNLEKSMRMPILAYFLIVGAVLFGGMRLVSSQLEAKPLPVSQRIGVPAPFKVPPDQTYSPRA